MITLRVTVVVVIAAAGVASRWFPALSYTIGFLALGLFLFIEGTSEPG